MAANGTAGWIGAGLALTAGLWSASRCPGQSRPLRELIDAEVAAVWKEEKVAPAGPADDAAFLRRVFLDLVGDVPTYDDARGFLADSAPDKRSRLIDRLLADPRFARQQAAVWDLVFFGRHPNDSELTNRRDLFQKWLVEKFEKNEPYDQWVRELLTAAGNTKDVGPVMFQCQFRGSPEEAAVAVSRIFLGTQLQCARCHNHPFDKWTQTDFYGFAGFFARTAFVENSAAGKRHYLVAEKSTGEVLFTGPAGKQKAGQKGRPVPAKFLAGAVLQEPPLPKDFKEADYKTVKTAPAPVFSRKQKLAEWVTSPTNPYFAKAAVNRVWAQFMGRGLVHPVDDLGDNAQATHPRLLKEMAAQLAAHGFDLKRLIRELVNSRTYQLAATGPVTAAMPVWFERARVRPLSAEEMLAALRTATGFDNASRIAGEKPGREKLPGAMREYMVRYFGEPMDGQGEFQAGLAEHLFFGTGSQVRQIIRRKKGNLTDAVLGSQEPWEARVDRMFLSVLCRPAKAEERARFVAFLTSDPKAEGLVEEAIWVLLNCSEFRFNR
jgi:hypothetical protein